MTIKTINGPAHEFAGPSLGHSTENGDNWHTAVAKINGNFKELESRLEKIGSDKPEIKIFTDSLNDIKSWVTEAIDMMTSRMAALEAAIRQPDPAPSSPPQPPAQPPAHPYPQSPAEQPEGSES